MSYDADTSGLKRVLEIISAAAKSKGHVWGSDPKDRELGEIVGKLEIENLRAEFEAEQNSLCVWEAIRLMHLHSLSRRKLSLSGVDTKWVDQYLVRTADNLGHLETGDGFYSKVAIALGLASSGRGNELSRFKEQRIRFRAAARVHSERFLRQLPATATEAYSVAARIASEELGKTVSTETVRDWYSNYHHWFTDGEELVRH